MKCDIFKIDRFKWYTDCYKQDVGALESLNLYVFHHCNIYVVSITSLLNIYAIQNKKA